MTTFLFDKTHDPRTRDTEVTVGTDMTWIVGEEQEGSEDSIQRCLSELAGSVETLTSRPLKWVTQIRDLGEEEYVLVEPIQIVIEEYSDNSVIARFPEVEVFGEGFSEPEAITNLKIAILDLYDELTETNPDTLGDIPKAWLRVLHQIITKDS
ncbi:MAG: hypothetical protein SXV54_21080 [Chloroflexota bacterium]|nr:hypothetical protein [Chloroflexota bacterium]